MAEPHQGFERDDDFLASLGKHLGAALGIVALMAGLFWGVGSVDGEAGELVVADGPTTPSDPGTDADPTTPSESGSESPPPSPSASEDAPATPTETDTAAPSPEETTPAEAGTIPPSEISIQVLDAVRIDGNTATEELADRLEDDGYDVVVVQDAAKVYDVTTVFYTPGFADSARQLAAQYGFSRVEEKPDNLSDTVRVHLVVGRDRA